MKQLGKIELAKKKMAMRVRAGLRLAAQEQYADALNEALPAAEARFDQMVLEGKLPAPIDFQKAINGEDETSGEAD